jgi:hypothetical protein
MIVFPPYLTLYNLLLLRLLLLLLFRIRPCGLFPMKIDSELWALETVGRTLGRGISPSQGRYLHTGQHKEQKQIDIHARVGFEPTIPVFKRAKHCSIISAVETASLCDLR